jgi:hypothetical protein
MAFQLSNIECLVTSAHKVLMSGQEMLRTLPNHSSHSVLWLPTDFFTCPTRCQSVVTRAMYDCKRDRDISGYGLIWISVGEFGWTDRGKRRETRVAILRIEILSPGPATPKYAVVVLHIRQWSLLIIVHRQGDEIPVRNTINAHAQDIVANDELLLPILKSFVQYSSWLHATRNAWYLQSLFIRNVCRCQQQQSRSPSYNQHPPHRARHVL